MIGVEVAGGLLLCRGCSVECFFFVSVLVFSVFSVLFVVLVAVDAGGFVSFSAGVLLFAFCEVGVVVFVVVVVVVFFLGEKKESI